MVRERPAFRGRAYDLVREPDALVAHVRFDERGEETGSRWRLRHRHEGESRRQQRLPSTYGRRASPRLYSPRRQSVGLTAFQWFSYPYEFESPPADSNAVTKAEIRRCPGAFDLPPALMSEVSPPRADSRAESVPRTPSRASSIGLVLANSEADGLALAPEPSATTPHGGSSRKTTARPCAS